MIQLLKRSGIEIAGKECVVVGRSNIVGKPMALLLLRENGTVTVAHSRTKGSERSNKEGGYSGGGCRQAEMITAEYVKRGAVVIDVGNSPQRRKQVVRRCGL